MARFHPLYVRRSDGVLEGTQKKREKNEPTADQLDPTPDKKGVSDYYRLLSKNDAKHLDWRRKLGGMLIREVGGKEHPASDQAYILYDFPENYRLYEHIKSKAAHPKAEGDDAEALKSTKTHAGGGHDRQDAYLYGHPLGRKKRYRSPADFFPHLLWLATDPQGDPNNCTCKLCAPEELQPDEPKANHRPTNQTQVVVEIPPRQVSQTPHTPIARPTSAASIQTARGPTPQPQALIPTPLPQPRSFDQQLDLQYGVFLYRPGELVWFNRGVAWGLGVLLRRYRLKVEADASSDLMRGYIVQPLSHPFDNAHPVHIFRENDMRPWLAWSAPAFTHQALNNVPKVSYHMMDWQSLLNKKWGEGDAQVDGSIMAARTVDASYSLFSSIKTSTPEPGIQERRFNGIYLGGEKLWLGDPARLKNGSGFDVIVLSEIIERTKTGYGGQSTDPTIQVVGDVFQLNNVPATQQQLPSDTGLPQRMREDLKQRNLVAIAARRPLVYWKLVQSLARFGIENIKGRWYEPTTLLPILHGEDYARKKAEGDIEDTGKWMNSRGDAQQDAAQKNLLVPKADRLAALGKAVPPGTGILDGIDPPSHEELTAVFARMAGTGGEDAQHSQQQVEPVALEEFMDFEKMAADAYGSQYTGQHFGGA